MTDVKAVQLSRPLLQAGVRLATAAPVAQKSDPALSTDGGKNDGKKSGDAIQKAPSPSSLFGFTPDDLKLYYEAALEARRGISGGTRRFKHYSAKLTTATVQNTSATPWTLNDVAQGTDSNEERLGLQIRSKRCSFRFQVTWSSKSDAVVTGAGAGDQPRYTALPLPVRVIVFVDKMPAIGAPTQNEDVVPPVGNSALLNTLTMGNTNNSIAAWNYNTHGERYEILRDEILDPMLSVPMSSGGAPMAGVRRLVHHWDIPLHFTTSFYSATGTNMLENRVCVMFMCDTRDNTTYQTYPTYEFTSDYMFEDMMPIE